MASISQKTSSVPGKQPLPADIQRGELAVNLADKKIFTKDHTDNIVELGGGLSITDNKVAGGIQTLGAVTGVQFAADGTYFVPLTGGTGTGAALKVVVSGGTIGAPTVYSSGQGYTNGDALTIAAGAMGKYSTAGAIAVTGVQNVLPAPSGLVVGESAPASGTYEVQDGRPSRMAVASALAAGDVLQVVRNGQAYQLPVSALVTEIERIAKDIQQGGVSDSPLAPPSYAEVILDVLPDPVTFEVDMGLGFVGVDWGDGTINQQGTHTFADADVKRIALFYGRPPGDSLNVFDLRTKQIYGIIQTPANIWIVNIRLDGSVCRYIGNKTRFRVSSYSFYPVEECYGTFLGVPDLADAGWQSRVRRFADMNVVGANLNVYGSFVGKAELAYGYVSMDWIERVTIASNMYTRAQFYAFDTGPYVRFPNVLKFDDFCSHNYKLTGPVVLDLPKCQSCTQTFASCKSLTSVELILPKATTATAICNGGNGNMSSLSYFKIYMPEVENVDRMLEYSRTLKEMTVILDFGGNTRNRTITGTISLWDAVHLTVTTIPPGNHSLICTGGSGLQTFDGDPFALWTGTFNGSNNWSVLKNQKLDLLSVRGLLESLAKAVTAGTCTGGTFDISGGTNAAAGTDPASQAAIATLQGGGVTVTTN